MTKSPSYIDCASYKNEVYTWVRDHAGNLKTIREHASRYSYLFIPDNTGKNQYQNIYGVPMKKVCFDSPWDMRGFADTHADVHESDIQPHYKALLDNFSDSDSSSPYNILFFDIEVDFDLEEGTGYPTPENPFGEINAISTYDNLLKKYIMYVPAHLKGEVRLEDEREGIPVETIWCSSEREMLMLFSSNIDHVDILTAWNGDNFDIRYIMERAIHHFGDDGLSLLCRENIPAKKREFTNAYGENTWEWNLFGRAHLDMMVLLKKFEPGERESFALEAVCQEVLGEGKIHFEDDLGSLYRENPQLFFTYSLHDARLIRMFNDKKKIIELGVLVARWACARLVDSVGAVKLIDQDFIKYCRTKGNIVVPDGERKEKQKYQGAIVFDTVEGRHEWSFGVDVKSMYPHCIMLLGLSPETMVMQCENRYDDFVHIVTRDDSHGPVYAMMYEYNEIFEALPSEIHDLIKEQGYTISANGTIFSGEMGLFAQYMKDGFAQRGEYKKMSKEAYQRGDKLMGDVYDLYQTVVKLRLNSFYGITGNVNFRFFHLDIAESITCTAQVVGKWQAYKLNEAVDLLMEA